MSAYVTGQRFVSEAEPDLGLGLVECLEGRRLTVRFPASDTVRQYAVQSAPIKRVLFRIGDEVADDQGHKFRVETIEEVDGLVAYRGAGQELVETALSGMLRFEEPEQRLLGGLWDEVSAFDLRYRTWRWGHRIRQSKVRGFLGARIELIPHQLYIAAEIAARPLPRALLADEVGLGKTIEAGLILHRLLRSERVSRVIVLVPDSLVHQWWVEMFRRFHLSFTIVNASYCDAVEVSEPSTNPFATVESVIVSLDWLTKEPARIDQISRADWEMVVVDEAHHIHPSGPAFDLVAALAGISDGLLLLTATPEQLGEESHFARLRLLDPGRYPSFPRYREQAYRYRDIASAVSKLVDHESLTEDEQHALDRAILPNDGSLSARLDAAKRGDRIASALVIDELIDRHGPGRVVFRNARSVLDRIPERRVHAVELDWPPDSLTRRDALAKEFVLDTSKTSPESTTLAFDFDDDPRARWLIGLLEALVPEKVLVLCRFKEKAVALHEALRTSSRVLAGLFHEDLSLLQRDRNAAWFAEEEGGAQVLICSEIGSEGRNFQFAHHLVMFDLPLNPELLEQRIGRLYRIGQEHSVEIHVPVLRGSAQQILFRWYHEGLDAFESSLFGGAHFDEIAELTRELALAHLDSGGFELPDDVGRLLEQTRELRTEVGARLEEGRDRLLELGSHREDVSRALVTEIEQWDDSRALDRYVLDVLGHVGVELEEVAPRTYLFRKGNQLIVDDLPGLRGSEVAMTASRERATRQGELDFLTWDHPMVTGVMEVLTSSEQGNSSVCFLPRPGPESLLLEAVFVLDVVAPAKLYLDRFLPPTPLRLVVDERLRDVTKQYPVAKLKGKLRDARQALRYADRGWQDDLVPGMSRRARDLAASKGRDLVTASRQHMNTLMEKELRRLRALSAVNDHIRPEEIARLEQEIGELDQAIAAADVRLDALRLIWRTPSPPES